MFDSKKYFLQARKEFIETPLKELGFKKYKSAFVARLTTDNVFQFIDFQKEYTAIENSLRTETVRYNESVENFNNLVQKLPGSILASFFPKFSVKPTFKATAGAEKAPEVFTE